MAHIGGLSRLADIKHDDGGLGAPLQCRDRVGALAHLGGDHTFRLHALVITAVVGIGAGGEGDALQAGAAVPHQGTGLGIKDRQRAAADGRVGDRPCGSRIHDRVQATVGRGWVAGDIHIAAVFTGITFVGGDVVGAVLHLEGADAVGHAQAQELLAELGQEGPCACRTVLVGQINSLLAEIHRSQRLHLHDAAAAQVHHGHAVVFLQGHVGLAAADAHKLRLHVLSLSGARRAGNPDTWRQGHTREAQIRVAEAG